MSAAIDRCRREQAEALAWLEEHGHEHAQAEGARLGLEDWFREELMIEEEERNNDR